MSKSKIQEFLFLSFRYYISLMNIKDKAKEMGLKTALSYLEKDPDTNIPRLIELVEKHAPHTVQLDTIKEALNDKDNNWNILLKSLYTDIDDGVRKKLFTNFIINSFYRWKIQHDKLVEEYGCNIPWTILMDPTSACNLHCTGCWAAEYGDSLNLSYEELDDIIEQGKRMGMRFFLFSGGEPLVRKKDIIRLCEKHDDSVFSCFTNGTLIDEEFACEMLRVKNLVPAISVEGFEAATDSRRGDGTYAKVLDAMRILRRYKLPFGVSCCYTSTNVDVIGSEEYFDWMVDMGAKFCWLFTFMPVGIGAPTELMVTAEQRKKMYDVVRAFRKTKPIFTLDFWNDGEYVKGCIAGGRYYLHINANGDIEPCAFIHYSDSNIRNKSLLDALRSPLFLSYKAHQPYNQNHLRPCPLLDNYGELALVVKESHALSTDLEHREDVDSLCEKCHEKAEEWAPVADELWGKSHPAV